MTCCKAKHPLAGRDPLAFDVGRGHLDVGVAELQQQLPLRTRAPSSLDPALADLARPRRRRRRRRRGDRPAPACPCECSSKSAGHTNSSQQHQQHAARMRDRLGQGPGLDQHAALADRPPHAASGTGSGAPWRWPAPWSCGGRPRRPAASGPGPRGCPRSARRSARRSAGSASSRSSAIGLLVGLRPPQRQHGDHLRVRLVDVFLHGVFDLRGQVAGVAGVPHRVAGGHHGRGQPAQQADRCSIACRTRPGR